MTLIAKWVAKNEVEVFVGSGDEVADKVNTTYKSMLSNYKLREINGWSVEKLVPVYKVYKYKGIYTIDCKSKVLFSLIGKTKSRVEVGNILNMGYAKVKSILDGYPAPKGYRVITEWEVDRE